VSDLEEQVHDALDDLARYLADKVPPLMVADAISVLLEHPPELVAEELRIWVVEEFQARGGGAGVAPLFYQGLKKVQQLEELALVRDDRFANYLDAVVGALAKLCPAEERERFTEMAGHLRETSGRPGSRVDLLRRSLAAPRQRASGETEEAPLSAEELRDLRRFTLLLERALAGNIAEKETEQLLVLAAAGARDARELETRLEQIRSAGLGPALGRDLVRSLVGTLPEWNVGGESGSGRPESRPVEAVRRAVQLAGDQAATGDRWKELLRAAAEELNRGALGRAVTLIDLADRMVSDGEVDPQFAAIAKTRAHEHFEAQMLLQASAEARNRPILRRLLEFHPGWAVRELLDDLASEPDPKRRRLLLALLQVWGSKARPSLVERLASTLVDAGRDPNIWWYQRNLVYLLRRIPRLGREGLAAEIELIGPFSALSQPLPIQKETFLLLSQERDERAAEILVRRLAEAERALEAPSPPHPPAEVGKLLSTLAVALARSGSPTAHRALVEHGLSRRPRWGDTLARLRELASVDLSDDWQSLERLLGALEALAPRRVLGFVVGRGSSELEDVARALAGTQAADVRARLAELAERYPDLDLSTAGEQAAALDATAVEDDEQDARSEVPLESATERALLSGDLELFGLPELLQSLHHSASSGALELRGPEGTAIARIELWRGRVVDCRVGRLQGEDAFYELFESPAARSFEFVRSNGGGAGGAAETVSLTSLLMEAMRRYDELQRATALVPDGALLSVGAAKPTVPTEESDGELVRETWKRVRSGATPRECEQAASTDRYRIRRLLAHWVEEGALAVGKPPS